MQREETKPGDIEARMGNPEQKLKGITTIIKNRIKKKTLIVTKIDLVD